MKQYNTIPSSDDIGSRNIGWLNYHEAKKIPSLKRLIDKNRLSIENGGELWIHNDDGSAYKTVNQYT